MSKNVTPQRVPADAAGAEIQLLRAHVEREVNGNAVILVTSAKAGDGKSLTATALADCLARSGRRTALVEPMPQPRLASGGSGDDAIGSALSVPMPTPNSPAWRRETAQFIELMRSSHEFTVIDGGALLASEMTMAFAQVADGVLLSVRIGRAPCDEDQLTARMLERSGGRVLGVVAAAPAAIGQFERKRTVNESAAPAAGARGGVTWMRPARRVLVALVAAVALTLGAGVASSSHVARSLIAPVAASIGGALPLRNLAPTNK